MQIKQLAYVLLWEILLSLGPVSKSQLCRTFRVARSFIGQTLNGGMATTRSFFPCAMCPHGSSRGSQTSSGLLE